MKTLKQYDIGVKGNPIPLLDALLLDDIMSLSQKQGLVAFKSIYFEDDVIKVLLFFLEDKYLLAITHESDKDISIERVLTNCHNANKAFDQALFYIQAGTGVIKIQ